MLLKKIAIILVVVIVAILGYASTKPDDFRYERSLTINAPADKIFPILNDFHSSEKWSAWEKVDPAMKKTLSGAESGKGAVYEWEGNNEIGAGRMEIIDSVPSSKISMTLDFIKPMEGHSFVDYTLVPDGTGTKVTSAMYGPNTFMGKVMSVFMDCEKMINDKTDESLAALKVYTEQQ